MAAKEKWFRYGLFPLAVGLAELAADGLLPSSSGVTNPAEEIAEGFLAAEAGVIVGTVMYRLLCKKINRQIDPGEESGFAIMGGVVGLMGMIAVGLALHELLGVTDVSWWPR